MANLIKLKRSAEAGKAPTTNQLELGEIAINTHDGRMYIKKDNGAASVVEVGGELGQDIDRCGFVDPAETTIAFDGTNTFTLGDAGNGWSYYLDGKKYTVTGNKTVNLSATPPAAAGKYFVSISNNATGTLSVSTTGWDFRDPLTIPVALLHWDNTLTPKFWLADERHSTRIDRRAHYYLHTTRGTQVSGFGEPTGYTVQPVTPTNTDNTFGIGATTLQDEDIIGNLSALTDPNGSTSDYAVFYRNSPTNWIWVLSTMPYPFSGTYIQYDNAGTLTTGQSGKYYNTYLVFSMFQGAARFIFVPGRGEFNDLASAQAENPIDFDWTTFGANEYVIAYQFTWRTDAAYTTSGKCRLEAYPRKINVATEQSTPSATFTHNSLDGIQGGQSGEYYHVNAAEYTVIHATGGKGAVDEINAANDTTTTTLYPVMVSAAGSDLDAKVSTGNLVFNASTGNLGIGNTAPSEKLEVTGTILSKSSSGWSLFKAEATSASRSAATVFRPFDTLSASNPEFFIGQKNDNHGKLSIWKYDGTSHSANFITVDSLGNVGIGTTAPGGPLIVTKSSDSDPTLGHFYNTDAGTSAQSAVYITNSSSVTDGLFLKTYGTGFTTSGGFIQDGSAIGSGTGVGGGLSLLTLANAPMRFYTNGNTNERARITGDGKVLIGATVSVAGSTSGSLDIQNTGSDLLSLTRFTNSAGTPAMYFNKSRGASVGTNTIVEENDWVGGIYFTGANGSGYSEAAYIAAQIDGTPDASADMPGRITFATSADGSASPSERVRITKNGYVLIGQTASILGNSNTFTAEISGVGTTNGLAGLQINSFVDNSGYGGNLYLNHVRSGVIGTVSTAAVANTELGTIGFGGSNGTTVVSGVTIQAYAGSLWTGSNREAYLTIKTTPLNSNTNTECIRVMSDGKVGIGTTAPAELLEVNGKIKHGGLVSTPGTEVDQVKTITVNLTLSTAWQDTTINGNELATGTYIVQLYSDDYASGGGHYAEYYSGIMSWYDNNTNESSSDEIILHRAGHANNNRSIYLRTIRTLSANTDDLKLQIAGNGANTGAADYIFKFRRLI